MKRSPSLFLLVALALCTVILLIAGAELLAAGSVVSGAALMVAAAAVWLTQTALLDHTFRPRIGERP